MKNKTLSFFILLTSFAIPTFGKDIKTVKNQIKAKLLFQTNEVIWSFAFVSPHELLITEREGGFYYFNTKTKEKIPIKTPPIKVTGQGGLLDVHLHTHNDQPYAYITFSEKYNGIVTTSLAKGLYKNKMVKDWNVIFRANIKSDTSRHFGSRLVFVDHHIFMTIGDRGERNYAQELSLHNGKILKLNLKGKPAKNNPFIDNKKALPEIWSYGHRNPQGIAYDRKTNTLYSSEFGPRGGDELNLIEKGKNYGWPIITYGKEYWGPSIGDTHKKGMEQPLAYWVPSISPSGMAIYTGSKILEWKNSLFLANLSSHHLRRLVVKNKKVLKQEVLFKNLNERIRHVRNGMDGYLYFSTDSGKLYKISY